MILVSLNQFKLKHVVHAVTNWNRIKKKKKNSVQCSSFDHLRVAGKSGNTKKPLSASAMVTRDSVKLLGSHMASFGNYPYFVPEGWTQ